MRPMPLNALLFLAACVRDDGFSRRLQAECVSLETCSKLANEASRRSGRCKDDDRCEDERGDYAWAVGQVRRYEAEQRERDAAERKRQQEERAERARQEYARKVAEEEERVVGERKRREEARAAEERARKEDCDRRRAAEENRSDDERADIVGRLLDQPGFRGLCTAKWQAGRMKDARSIAAAKATARLTKALKAFDAEQAADAIKNRGLLCRDGASSDCLCAGSHQGCCSGHGGVSGCAPVEKPQPLQCPPPPDPCEVIGKAHHLPSHRLPVPLPLVGPHLEDALRHLRGQEQASQARHDVITGFCLESAS